MHYISAALKGDGASEIRKQSDMDACPYEILSFVILSTVSIVTYISIFFFKLASFSRCVSPNLSECEILCDATRLKRACSAKTDLELRGRIRRVNVSETDQASVHEDLRCLIRSIARSSIFDLKTSI